MENYPFYSYLTATVTYFLLLLLTSKNSKNSSINILFTLAVFVSCIWTGFVTYVIYDENLLTETTLPFETLRNIAWFIFISILILNQQYQRNYTVLLKTWQSYPILLFFMAAIALDALPEFRYMLSQFVDRDMRLYTHVTFAIIGLILIEQLYRNASIEQHWAIKFLCLSLGASFMMDLIVYSKSLLFSKVDFALWNSRGFINTILVPLLLVSHHRLQNDSTEITLSRKLVFHTMMLFFCGIYLILMSFTGYYIREYGGTWGETAKIIFIFLAILFLLLLFISGKTRAKVKVFINKHFFHYNYDYREEWIKVSKTLATLDSISKLSAFIINTLAELVDSSGGELWLKNDSGDFYLAESKNVRFKIPQIIPASDPCISFINNKKWVIDFVELDNEPEVYAQVDLSKWYSNNANMWLIIPLFQQNEMLAFVVLSRSMVPRQLNWEDHDLLETIGLQLANALMLCHTSDELARSRQFEAYNRISAYLVHDLKNLVAQVSLIVKNAEKHKHNPEFIDDSILTLQNVASKMQHLVDQLKKGHVDVESTTQVNLAEIVLDVTLQQLAQRPIPKPIINVQNCLVYAEKDKLTAILGHLIQNAQEATADDGFVNLELCKEKDKAIITLSDNGTGMDTKFISERLFKPFDTTKGNAGMGIGVYEAREYILKLSGQIRVTSKLGEGTEFTIELPLTDMR